MSILFRQVKPVVYRYMLCGIFLCAVQSNNVFAQSGFSFEDVVKNVESYQQQDQLLQDREYQAALILKNSQLWQNPSLSIEQTGFGQEQELSIGIRQPLDVFGQRQLAQQSAHINHEQMQLQAQLYQQQLSLIVKVAWVNSKVAYFEQLIYQTQRELSAENLNAVKKRYQAGSIALVDYERAQIEDMENQRLLDQAILTRQMFQAQLLRLWGKEDQANQKFDFQPEQIWPTTTAQEVTQSLAQGWLNQRYRLDEQQLQYTIQALKLKAKPQPTLNLGVNQSKSADNSTDRQIVVGVEIPIQLFNRQQYRIPVVQTQKALVLRTQQHALEQQQQGIKILLQQLQTLEQQYQNSQQQTALATQVQKRTVQGFSAGKFSLTDVQQANLQLQNIKIVQIQLVKQAWQIALTASAQSLGLTLEQVSAPDAIQQLNQQMLEQSNDLLQIGGE